MTTRARDRDRASLIGADRLDVFVPAIMGVGLVFWLMGELHDLVRATGDASRDKRSRIAGHAVASNLLGSAAPDTPEQRGLRSRPVYLLLAISLLGGAVYVQIGSIANYVNEVGYVADIAWLLALASVVSVASFVLGIVAATVFVQWPRPQRWTDRLLARSLLTTRPISGAARLARPSWRLGAGVTAAIASAALLSLMVAVSPHVVEGFDRRLGEWLQRVEFGWWSSVTDAIFGAEGVVALAVAVSVAALRCRALTAAYLTATGLGLFLSMVLRAVTSRDRPATSTFTGGLDSFPSGHVLQAALITVLLPMAVAALAHRRTVSAPLQFLLALLALGSGVDRVSTGSNWATDVIGGALIGLALGLGARWVVTDQRAHTRCRGCAWAIPPDGQAPQRSIHHLHRGRPAHPERSAHPHLPLGLIELTHSSARLVGAAATATSVVVVLGLGAVTVTGNLPRNGGGYVFGAAIERPVQLALAGLVSIGALVGRRWAAPGAVLMALAAALMGVFAAIEYPPWIATSFALALMAPAVLRWLAWQHDRTPHEIAIVAAVTVILVGATWFGARAVYDEYFGPTHPESVTPSIRVDEVEWVLAGGLQSDSIMVTARLVDTRAIAALTVRDADGVESTSPSVAADAFGVVRLGIDGLRPDTDYTYRVLVGVDADQGRGWGAFRTPAEGPMSFEVVLASCARTGSNAAVFDTMAAEKALFYLALGDIHYGNIESTDPGAFHDAFDRLLIQPAQAAFYRSTPFAYVWDDHDYGPNDADSSSPGRDAVAAAYRSVVPSYHLADDTAIHQAFTIGRVRFIMTDTRSQKTDTTMLGPEQLGWLVDELVSASRSHALVVWVNAVPWVGAASPGADGWAGYPDERRAISDAIVAADIENLVMVSGDAHMVAIDDGTNTDYSTNGDDDGMGFPLLHTAALDRPGSVKGGPYSEGVFPGGGQYGVLEVNDDGNRVEVTLSGHTWDDQTLVTFTLTVPPADGPNVP